MARRRRLPAQAVVDDSEVQVVAVDKVVAVDSVDVTVRVSVKKKKGSRSPTWLESIEMLSGEAKQPAAASKSKSTGEYMVTELVMTLKESVRNGVRQQTAYTALSCRFYIHGVRR